MNAIHRARSASALEATSSSSSSSSSSTSAPGAASDPGAGEGEARLLLEDHGLSTLRANAVGLFVRLKVECSYCIAQVLDIFEDKKASYDLGDGARIAPVYRLLVPGNFLAPHSPAYPTPPTPPAHQYRRLCS